MHYLQQQWKDLMFCAKQAYANQAYNKSISLNKSALKLSKSCFTERFSSEDPDQAIAAVLVSYFNIADNYIASHNIPLINDLFKDALSFLLTIKCQPQLTQTQYTAVINGAKSLQREWTLFLRNNLNELPSSDEAWLQQLPNEIAKLYDQPAINVH